MTKQLLLAAPVAAVLALPFWSALVLDQRNIVEVAGYLVLPVVLAVVVAFGDSTFGRWFAPKVCVAIAGLALATAGVIYTTAPRVFAGPAEQLVELAWLVEAFAMFGLVQTALRLRARWSRGRRTAVGFVLLAIGGPASTALLGQADPNRAAVACAAAVALAGVSLIPTRWRTY